MGVGDGRGVRFGVVVPLGVADGTGVCRYLGIATGLGVLVGSSSSNNSCSKAEGDASPKIVFDGLGDVLATDFGGLVNGI